MPKILTILVLIVLIALASTIQAEANQKVFVIAIVDDFVDDKVGATLEMIVKNFIHDLSAEADLMLMATGNPEYQRSTNFSPIKIISRFGTSRVQTLQQYQDFKPNLINHYVKDFAVPDFQSRNRYMLRLFDSLSVQRPLLIVRFASNSPLGPMDQLPNRNTHYYDVAHPVFPLSNCYDRLSPFKHIEFAQMGFFSNSLDKDEAKCLSVMKPIHNDASVVARKPVVFLKRYRLFLQAIQSWIRAQPKWSDAKLVNLAPDVWDPAEDFAGLRSFFSSDYRILFAHELQFNAKLIKRLEDTSANTSSDTIFKWADYRTQAHSLWTGYGGALQIFDIPRIVSLLPDARFLISNGRAPRVVPTNHSPAPGECLLQRSERGYANFEAMLNFTLNPGEKETPSRNLEVYDGLKQNNEWILYGYDGYFDKNFRAIACRIGPNLKSNADIVDLFRKSGFSAEPIRPRWLRQ